MFASAALARRIEAAEARLTLSCGRAIARRVPSALVRELGAAAAVFAGADSPMDKVLGLGFDPFDAEAFARFEGEVLARGGSLRVEQSSLADPEVARALIARGYALVGYENVLGRTPGRGEAGGDATVGRVEGDELEAWIDLMASAFLSPDADQGAPPPTESFDRAAIEQAGRDLAQLPGMVRYLARRGGEAAGGASMRVDGGIAQLTGAATLPAHRRRGVQTALLAARLHDAAALGCDLAVVTTGPGTKSAQNAARNGFSLLYVRAILTRS
jgi:GNAT superfamily N-acetyltransferase